MNDIKGSARSTIACGYSKHTVSQVMKLDSEKILELCYLDKVVPSYLTSQSTKRGKVAEKSDTPLIMPIPPSLGWFTFKSFSAEDDDVRWRLEVRHTKQDDDSDLEFSVHLSLLKKTFGAILLYWKASRKIHEPFFEKPHNEPYAMLIEKDVDVCYDLPPVLYLTRDEAQQGFKVDITYAKVKTWEYVSSEPLPAENKPIIDVEFLLGDPIGSDITVKSGDKKWKLHKWILSARSKVFKAMFTTEMKEKTADLIEIKDVDSKAVDVMIKYIYTGRVEGLDREVGLQVLYLSDLYDLPILKSNCEANLISELNVKDCLSTFIHAGKWSNNLRNAAKSKICSNISVICKSDEWREFVKKEFDLSVEIISQSLSAP